MKLRQPSIAFGIIVMFWGPVYPQSNSNASYDEEVAMVLEPSGEQYGTFIIESPSFEDYATMPKKHTCEGNDISPPLAWSGIPDGTKSLALIVDDPDAPDPAKPTRTVVHWILFNIPSTVTSLPEGVDLLPPGTRVGLNFRDQTGYMGPCPPIGAHRYFFKLFALDAPLDIPGTPTKAQLEAAMIPHVLGQATIVGMYAKQ